MEKLRALLAQKLLNVSTRVRSCVQTLYALRTLQACGMDDTALQTIYCSTLSYACSAWLGFTSATNQQSEVSKVSSFCQIYRYLQIYVWQHVKADENLFDKVITDKKHVLHMFAVHLLTYFVFCE